MVSRTFCSLGSSPVTTVRARLCYVNVFSDTLDRLLLLFLPKPELQARPAGAYRPACHPDHILLLGGASECCVEPGAERARDPIVAVVHRRFVHVPPATQTGYRIDQSVNLSKRPGSFDVICML